jgi:ribosome biogenesis protein ENP2
MVLTVTHSHNVKMYNLSSGKTIEEFMKKHKSNLKSLRNNVDWESRVDFIQNFEFTTGSSKVVVSDDGDYIVASGIYGPQLRIYDTAQLGLKCLRGCDSEIVDFALLEEDYKKIAMVCVDRNVEIHARHGKHFKVRVPRAPRCLLFERNSADLLVGGSSDELYRLSLHEGRFQPSYKVSPKGVSTLAYNQGLDLVLAGGDDGQVSLIDHRLEKVASHVTLNDGEGVTVLKQSDNPFEFFVGSSEGLVRVYDLRISRHLAEKRHPYMLPIKDIEFAPQAGLVLSCDSKTIRIQRRDKLTELVAVFEQKTPINNLKIFKDSGLLLYANDAPKIGALFIPALGPAPRFCQFLEHITEEFEEKTNVNVFEDQRFVTYEELVALNARHLIGSRQLKTHLNGFLVPSKIYESLRQQTDLVDYREYRADKVKQALEEKVRDAIYVKQNQIKINDKLSVRLQGDSKRSEKILSDPRFAKLWSNKDFEVVEGEEGVPRQKKITKKGGI